MTWDAGHRQGRGVARAAQRGVFAIVLLTIPVTALSQDPRAKPEEPGLFESIGRWLERQSDNIGSSFKDAGKGVENLGREAGVAARSTVDGAKEAAGAVARIPAARVITGHEKCRIAPNGAPDCVTAATAICRKNGFESGSSADMTTAEVCPAQVYLSGRSSGSECRTETFVSRALCQ